MNRRSFLKSSTLAAATTLLAAGNIRPGRAQAQQTYTMITFLSRLGFWVDCYRGMLDAAEFLGVEALYTGTPEFDPEAEAQILAETAAQQPNGILMTVLQPDILTPVINNVIDSGIPLVTFDADASLSKRYS